MTAPPTTADEHLLRELAPQVLGAVVRRYGNFAAAEDAVVRRLEELGRDLTLVSEELGIRTFGDGGEVRVVVDPIDGSVNAKRAIPFFSLSLAVADGPTMEIAARALPAWSKTGAATDVRPMTVSSTLTA